MRSLRALSLLLAFISFPKLAFAYAACPQGHCSAVDAEMNKFCISSGLAGKPYLVIGPSGGNCLCPCSCASPDTRVQLADFESTMTLGELALGVELASPYSEQVSSPVTNLLASDFTSLPVQVRQLVFSNGSELLVSSDHTFVTRDERVVSAQELHPGSFVLDGMGRSVELLSHEKVDGYVGRLMNVVVHASSLNAKDHFIINNDLRSGDWLIQASYPAFQNEIDVRLGLVKSFK
ncbi:MAG: hypothetical protein KA436_04640 [Oligoflexales bacterium]|nr:hypothetical protein [Oligoflexales bacterium]